MVMTLTIALHFIILLAGAGAFFLGMFSIFHHSRMFREFYSKLDERHDYRPSVSIIAPVRGVDKYLEENVRSLLSQDYPEKWEVLFIVDKGNKMTEGKIRKIVRRSRTKRAKIIQSVPISTCSGKSAAMIAGVKNARYEVIAGWDSDALVSKDWLSHLVAPLQDENIGVTTGYRFYVPSRKFSSYVLSLWNMLGFISMKGGHAFVWGGSFAVRKNTLKKLDIVKKWSAAIAEDVVLTDGMWKAKLRIYFVPACIVLSHLNAKSMLEFTTRQMTIVRWNRPGAYKFMFALLAFSRASIMLGLGALYLYLSTGNALFALESFLLLWYAIWSSLRASLDHRNFEILLSRRIGSRAVWVLADFFAQWLAFYSFTAALRKKSITWQGRSYNLSEN
jgi:cellulose synthase/poly-beta-1,6-N-acetylglucosamine synthase-like glycosyltransferase